MSREPVPIDREKVEKFFTQKNRKPTLYTLGMIAGFLGVALAFDMETLGFGVGLLTAAVVLAFIAFSMDDPLGYYPEVKRAKSVDFARVLLRSYNKTETDIDSLLDFDARDLVSLDPDAINTEDRGVLERLNSKSVYLAGKRDEIAHEKLLSVNGKIIAEYSPILVSILYLTKLELFVYIANVDITRGDLLVEEVNRFFLKDIVQITSGSKTRRLMRSDNADLFARYEKVTKAKVPDEIVVISYSIDVTRTDARHVSLPVGAPEYRSGKQGVLDSGENGTERYTRIAREVFTRINDAKARL